MKKSSVLINNRLEYIDFAKALGMFTIIWGHIIHYGWSNQIVYAFHIPLFFFMSGMVFKADKYNTVWEFIKKRKCHFLLSCPLIGPVNFWKKESVLKYPLKISAFKRNPR